MEQSDEDERMVVQFFHYFIYLEENHCATLRMGAVEIHLFYDSVFCIAVSFIYEKNK